MCKCGSILGALTLFVCLGSDKKMTRSQLAENWLPFRNRGVAGLLSVVILGPCGSFKSFGGTVLLALLQC